MFSRTSVILIAGLLAVAPAAATEGQPDTPDGEVALPPGIAAPAERLLDGMADPALAVLAREALERNPELRAAVAAAESRTARASRARSLPDPVAAATAWVASPETRVGPQQLTLSLSQGLPGGGKRGLKEEAELYTAAALEAEAAAKGLRVVTEVRRLAHELAFLDRDRRINEEFKTHLVQHEEISRGRYASGAGLGQGVIKLQAEITRVESRLLEIDGRRASVVAQLNVLRDRRGDWPLPRLGLTPAEEAEIRAAELQEASRRFRPELAAAGARIAQGEALIRLAEKSNRPDFRVGLTYTLVGRREDLAGQLLPPEGNGGDIFGIQGGVSLPLWGKSRAAEVVEGEQMSWSARQAERQVMARIEGAITDLALRIPLDWRRLRLLEDLLLLQAREALESALTGYVAGALNALDLLDAEHVLFETRTAIARAEADYLVALAQLEGEVGAPLDFLQQMERSGE